MIQWSNFLTSPNSIVEHSQKTLNTLEREKKKGITHHHFNMHCHNAPTTVCSKFCQSTQINSKSQFLRLLLVKRESLKSSGPPRIATGRAISTLTELRLVPLQLKFFYYSMARPVTLHTNKSKNSDKNQVSSKGTTLVP